MLTSIYDKIYLFPMTKLDIFGKSLVAGTKRVGYLGVKSLEGNINKILKYPSHQHLSLSWFVRHLWRQTTMGKIMYLYCITDIETAFYYASQLPTLVDGPSCLRWSMPQPPAAHSSRRLQSAHTVEAHQLPTPVDARKLPVSIYTWTVWWVLFILLWQTFHVEENDFWL